MAAGKSPKHPKITITHARIVPDALAKFDHKAIFYRYLVDGVPVRAIHWSGKWSGPVDELVDHLQWMAKHYQADYITTTETVQKGVMKEIAAGFPKKDWGVQKADEYLLIFRRETFSEIAWRRPFAVTHSRVKNLARWRQMDVGVFNIRHKRLKKRFRILPVHGPSGIQHGAQFKPGKQTQVAKEGWPKLGRNMRRFRRFHPGAVQIVPADCNAHLKLKFFMDWFEEQLGARCIWDNRLPKTGTHAGGRLIDAAWIL